MKNKLKPRAVCGTCRDTGLVSWHSHPTVACGWCEAGDQYKETHKVPEGYGKPKVNIMRDIILMSLLFIGFALITRFV